MKSWPRPGPGGEVKTGNLEIRVAVGLLECLVFGVLLVSYFGTVYLFTYLILAMFFPAVGGGGKEKVTSVLFALSILLDMSLQKIPRPSNFHTTYPSRYSRRWYSQKNIFQPEVFFSRIYKPIGVNTTAFGRKLTLFQRHPAFPLFA